MLLMHQNTVINDNLIHGVEAEVLGFTGKGAGAFIAMQGGECTFSNVTFNWNWCIAGNSLSLGGNCGGGGLHLYSGAALDEGTLPLRLLMRDVTLISNWARGGFGFYKGGSARGGGMSLVIEQDDVEVCMCARVPVVLMHTQHAFGLILRALARVLSCR